MTLPVDFHPAVHGEVDNAYRWYERRQTGLGQDFLDELQHILATIVANPARFGFTEGDIREGLLNRFPYAIYYRVLPDQIRVLAVYHTSRNPSGWRIRV